MNVVSTVRLDASTLARIERDLGETVVVSLLRAPFPTAEDLVAAAARARAPAVVVGEGAPGSLLARLHEAELRVYVVVGERLWALRKLTVDLEELP
jgi:precorrin-6B methylase 1